MIKKLLFCVLTIVVITAKSQVAATTVWVTNVGTDYSVSNISTALAANSDVHAAGETNVSPGNADIIVQRIDSSSTVLFTFNYDNGGYDSPRKIWVDAAGNTYIVGISWDPATDRDFIIIKLNSLGVQVWLKRFDGGINAKDEAFDIAVDGNSDVYVTGRSFGGSSYNSLTLKLDGTSGNQIWQHIFNPAGADCSGITMVLANNQSDVIVGSNVDMGSGTTDIAVYQISASSGSGGWQTIVNGTASGNDVCSKIILSGANVVLCGMVDNGADGNDYTTIKINESSGSIIFQNDYNYSSNDKATSLVRDSTGNIAVTGYVYNSAASVFKYHTLCYDSTGVQLWLNQKDINCSSLNVEPSIVCDTIVNFFYVAGEEEKASRDVLVYQITSSGSIGWKKNYDAIGSLDAATSLVVNGIGVVFVAANTSQSPGIFQITTLKIAQTPIYFPPDLGTPELKDDRFVFQENRGQLLHTDGTSVPQSEIGYYNQGCSPSYYFNNSQISHILLNHDTILDSLVQVNLKFLGSNPLADIYPFNPIEAKKHYFTTSAQGITDVTSYDRIFIPEVYANVDLHHYSNTSGLKSYFVFKTPGESFSAVRLKVDGANSTTIDGGGNLIAATDFGNINMGILTAYQATYNPFTPTTPVLVPLTVSWLSLGSDMYRFNVSGYLPFWPVVVYVSKPGVTSSTSTPPIGNLWWSTFQGEQGNDQMKQSEVDARDNYYTVGVTTAANFPNTPGGFQNVSNNAAGIQYGILNKFRPNGSPAYGTYYGGTSVYSNCSLGAYTQILDIAIDSTYNIYVVGTSSSKNLITQTISVSGALNYTANAGISGTGNYCANAFVAKFNPSGNVMRFGSYYGGTKSEAFNCVRYKNGHIYIGGYSASTSIPLVSPQPNTYQITSGEGFYMRLDTAGSVKHNTKFQNTIAAGDVDNAGNFYMISSCITGIAGGVPPIIAPATSFYTHSYNGNWDWVLQRMSANDSLTWSTPIGGTGSDFVSGIAIRDSVMAICGSGSSNDFPFHVAPGDSGDVAYGGGTGVDIQMMKFSLKTGSILWSAYHATNRDESSNGITLDKTHNLFVVGSIYGSSALSPKLVNAAGNYYQSTLVGHDAIILGYSNSNKKKWATFYGSSSTISGFDSDEPSSIVANNSGKLFISGQTNVKTNSLPLVKWNSVCYWDSLVADPSTSSNYDGFIAMFESIPPVKYILT